MWLYVLNIVAILIYSLLVKDKKKLVILIGLQLFLILALRDVTMGADLDNYYGGYNYIAKLDFSELLSSLNPLGVSELVWPYYYENGYTIFNWLASHIGLSFHGFLVICAAINIGSVSYFIYKYSKKPWLSFVIFCTFGFFMYDFGIIRHSLALSMTLVAYCFLDNRRYFPAILSFLVAFYFHRTAILALPLMMLLIFQLRQKMTRKSFSCMLLFTGVIAAFSSFIYNNIVVGVLSFMEKESYAGHDFELNKMVFLLYAIALVFVFAYNFSKNLRKMDNVAIYALLFAILLSIMSLYNGSLMRALPFYTIFLLILVPNIIEQYSNQKYTILLELLIVAFLTGYMYSIMADTEIVPYVLYDGVALL